MTPEPCLQRSITQFEDQLASLKAFPSTAAVRSALARLERAWSHARRYWLRRPARPVARELYDVSETLQQAAHS